MASLLERRLVIVTGKGGTGKTTVACALGLIGARRGLRTVVVELGGHQHLSALFGLPSGEELRVDESLWSASIDPDTAMFEWLATLTGRLSARMLTGSSTFQYFAAAAPGAKELVTMRRVLELCDGSSRRDGARGRTPDPGQRAGGRGDTPGLSGRPNRYDLVILDAPATGHALGMLRSPQTFSAIARIGPMAEQTSKVQQMLVDTSRCAYVAVTHPSEMAVAETLELEQELRRLLDRDLDAVFVNGTLPQRFTREEIAQFEQLNGGDPLVGAAVRSAQAAYKRARFQRSQIARLRRQRFAGGAPPGVLTIPFQFVPELDLAAIEAIADRLGRRL